MMLVQYLKLFYQMVLMDEALIYSSIVMRKKTVYYQNLVEILSDGSKSHMMVMP